MGWRIVVIVVLCSLGLASTARAQATPEASVLDNPFVRSEAKAGLDLLYDMQFEAALAHFERIDRRYPRHPIGPFLTALNTWWKILGDFTDTSHDKAFYASMEEVIRRADRMLDRDEDDFDARFFKGAALGFRGRLRSNRGDWLKAARDGIKAMDYVLGVAGASEAQADYAFGEGIYDYYADVVPERYPFVRPVMVFFPDGNRQAGLSKLRRVAEEGYYIQTEAVYFLLQIYYLFERDYARSLMYVTWLREHHPNNAFFHAFEGRVFARWGRWTQARPVFQEMLDRYLAGQTGYNAAQAEQALYYLARADMAGRQYRDALARLVQLEALTARNEEDTYFKIMGRLRQGMVYDALGQRDIAVRRYRQVLQMEDRAGSHDRAQRYLDRPYGR